MCSNKLWYFYLPHLYLILNVNVLAMKPQSQIFALESNYLYVVCFLLTVYCLHRLCIDPRSTRKRSVWMQDRIELVAVTLWRCLHVFPHTPQMELDSRHVGFSSASLIEDKFIVPKGWLHSKRHVGSYVIVDTCSESHKLGFCVWIIFSWMKSSACMLAGVQIPY